MSAVTQARTTEARDVRRHEDRGGPAIDHDEKLLLSVVEAARRLGIGRTLMYELINSGEVQSVHVGRLRKIPTAAVDGFVAGLCRRA